jgi:hypothetical protein
VATLDEPGTDDLGDDGTHGPDPSHRPGTPITVAG